jgi:hypothetical protein
MAAMIGATSVDQAYGQDLFTTQNDFTGWSSGANFNVAPVASPDLDNSAINGLASGGGAGTKGSLDIHWNGSTFDNSIRSSGLQGNAALVAALGSGGTFKATYTKPTIAAGNYFQLGIVLNYEGHFDQLGFSSEVNNGDGTYTGTVPFTFDTSVLAGGLDYLQIGVLWNSDWQPTSHFQIDNIRLVQVPEPSSIVLGGLTVIGLALGRRRGHN